MSYQPKVYREEGGDRQVVASGGSLDIESGGELDIESGGALKLAGTAVTATAAELNALDGITASVTELNYNDITTLGTTQASKTVTADGSGNITHAGTIVRASQQFIQSVAGAKAGATAGWTVNAGDNISLATLPASQTSATMVIPVTIPLKVGATITAFSVVGQIESAGNTVTLDADLRKHTAAAGDVADASVGAITQISKTADYAVSDAKASLAEVVAADETFYVLLTGTTAASTDIAIQGITITQTEL